MSLVTRIYRYFESLYLIFAPYSNGPMTMAVDLMMSWGKNTRFARAFLVLGAIIIIFVPVMIPVIGTDQYGNPVVFGLTILLTTAITQVPGSLRRIKHPSSGFAVFLVLLAVELAAIVVVVGQWATDIPYDYLAAIFWGFSVVSVSDVVAKFISLWLCSQGEPPKNHRWVY